MNSENRKVLFGDNKSWNDFFQFYDSKYLANVSRKIANFTKFPLEKQKFPKKKSYFGEKKTLVTNPILWSAIIMKDVALHRKWVVAKYTWN